MASSRFYFGVRPVVLGMSMLVVGMSSGSAHADLTFWSPATGDWHNSANWLFGFVPGTEATAPKQAAIMNMGAATISAPAPTLDEVWVGNADMNGTLNVVAGGSLNVTNAAQGGILVVGRTFSIAGAHSGSRLNVSGGSIVADGIEAGQVFGGDASTDAQIDISGNGSVTVKNFLRVGHGDSNITFGGQGVMTVRDNGMFTNDGTGTLPFINDFIAFGFNGGGGPNGGNHGTLNLEDNAIFSSKRPVRFGWVEEGHGTLNITGNAQLLIDSGELSAAAIMFGDFNNSAVGTGENRPVGIANQSGGTVTVGTDAARPLWTAIGGSGYGEYNISGGKLNIFVRDGLNVGDTDQNDHPGEGVINLSGTGVINATEMWFGKIGRATGTMNQTGGSVNIGIATADGNFVDRIDTMGQQTMLDPNLDGALTLGAGFDVLDANQQVIVPGASTGTYNISGGALHARHINVGFFANGTFTQSGNSTVISDTGFIVAFGTSSSAVPSTGIMNLNGGTMDTAAIGGGAGGNSTVNFNGTTIRPTVDQADFIDNLTTANVQAGGLIIDTNGFDVASNAQFSGAGGHTKRGAGTSALSGNMSYAGTTKVEAGTLLVNGSHTGGGAYTVDAGATLGGTGSTTSEVTVNGSLAPGTSIGTLTTGSVTFGNNSVFDIEIDAATHTADQLVVNGDLNLNSLSDMLRLTLIGGVLPEAGPLTIATYTGSLSGTFSLDNGNFDINYGTGTNSSITISNITSIDSGGGLPGDFNNNGVVDAADYTLWRDNLGAPEGNLLNGNGDGGTIGPSDYTLWKSNFGQMLGSGGGSLSGSSVPEPGTLLLATTLICGLGAVRRRSWFADGKKWCEIRTIYLSDNGGLPF